ncbi:MAG: hypothetical protein ACRC1K_01450 [Planctomycetia bacterium]
MSKPANAVDAEHAGPVPTGGGAADVFWMLKAVRSLEAEHSHQPQPPQPDAAKERVRVDGLLRQVFAGRRAVVVAERLRGFQRRPGQHILRVEASSVEGSLEAWIVKIGDGVELGKEYHGWRNCQPAGPVDDAILAEIKPAPPGAAEPLALLYSDANVSLGDSVLLLEDAFLRCVRHGEPTVASIRGAFQRIFYKLASRF